MRRQSLFAVGIFLWPVAAWGLGFAVSTPPGVSVSTPYGEVRSDLAHDMHRVHVPDTLKGVPIPVEVRGPFGGIVHKSEVPEEGETITVGTGIVTDEDSNPQMLQVLPALCPRVYASRDGLVYEGEKDLLNTVPVLQLLDPDAKILSKSANTVSQFDCKTVLRVESVTIAFDYEDPSRLKVDGPNGQKIWETHSGFYANFHIAVLPYSQALVARLPQTLLRIAEGKASERAIPLAPEWAWRTHSFLPGPFLSRTDFLYDMCEWGDTAVQAPRQIMRYEALAIWDWDYPVGDRLIVVVWEGDEEESLVNQGILPPGAIMDDFVGAFVVTRAEVDSGKTFVNSDGTFWIQFKTGDMTGCQ